jgi:alginate O-acetyltransferase complex protein AlgI
MLFNSIPFLGFAITVLAVWPIARRLDTPRWLTLTLASLAFYGFHGEYRWPSLVYITVAGATIYGLAILVERDRARRTLWLTVALVATLGGLAVFKYAAQAAALLNAHLGTKLPVRYPIPLAASFISFQLASYVIDVHRGHLTACRKVLQFFAYVTFFPKLIAGPVVRGSVMLTQLEKSRPTTGEQWWLGCRQFVIGLFMKNVVADNLGPLVNTAFAVAAVDSSAYWWAMAVIYTAQSYADFSGYSDMAIGMARLLGFEIPPNFAHPFSAAGFREFWGRWHISVSTWFRDYLFYPVAQRWLPRVAPELRHLAMHIAIWLVMVISGVWHGVAPGYAIWGALNAFYLSIEAIYNWPAKLARFPGGRVLAALITVLLWSFSQVIFRANDFDAALHIIRIMMSFNSLDVSEIVVDARRYWDAWWPLLIVAIAIQHVWVAWRRRDAAQCELVTGLREWLGPVGVASLLVLSIVLSGPAAEFVYFKF